MPGPAELAPALERAIRARQAERLPSVAAAVVRGGETVWSDAVGLADCEGEQGTTPDTQYRIGSITKTFTTVAVMQLRDAGALDLDDRLEQHLPGVRDGSPTIRRMLSHLSGLQREVGDMWVTGEMPIAAELVASDVEFVLPPARAHHYSNLAFALLGELVARRGGMPYTEYIDEQILRPLALDRTTWLPAAPAARGYLVDEYTRTARVEPATDLAGAAPAGQLWSTVGDLARWVTFLAEGRDGVLAAATCDELWSPQVMRDPEDWSLAWGLGLMLFNRAPRIFGGHGGAMPGHLAGAYIDRKTGIGAAALTNAGTRGEMDLLAIELAEKAIELWPPDVEAWRPEDEPPADVRALLGQWWSEGNEFVFWWERASLRARLVAAPPGRAPSVFERDGDAWRVVSGRERGERLRIVDGGLVWAGYPFTRDQQSTLG